MKIKTVPATKFALLCTALVGASLTFSDRASALSIRDAHELRSTYVNHLVGMALPSDERANGQYFRSNNSTPQAVLTDHVNDRNAGGPGEIITIPSPGGGPGPLGVPDGGITAMLLGAALGALGMARRYLMS
jgi:hypothetical protein